MGRAKAFKAAPNFAHVYGRDAADAVQKALELSLFGLVPR
jgi:hypothetical protein